MMQHNPQFIHISSYKTSDTTEVTLQQCTKSVMSYDADSKLINRKLNHQWKDKKIRENPSVPNLH